MNLNVRKAQPAPTTPAIPLHVSTQYLIALRLRQCLWVTLVYKHGGLVVAQHLEYSGLP